MLIPLPSTDVKIEECAQSGLALVNANCRCLLKPLCEPAPNGL